ncbi:MAG: Mrp/NBP35 family ATP-binding protein [Thermoplasmata archaeon]
MNEEYVRQTHAIAEKMKDVQNKIAVMSGKGGVGKSVVASLISVGLARKRKAVALLDGDITGASIPKIFGVAKKLELGEKGIIPVTSRTGVKIVSMNLLLEREDQAIIWRGPLVGSAIRQLLADTDWGKLDYLIVDMPPGTSDAPLSLVQALRLDGVLLVATPQELVGMIVSKAIDMLQQTNTKLSGIVLNMVSYRCPHCGNILYPFGRTLSVNRIQEKYGIPVLAEIPVDEKIAELCDAGKIEEYESREFAELADRLVTI